MPRMNILNTVEREAFNSPPVFNSFQRKQYFDFPSKLRRFAAGLRNPVYQSGFLLSAGYFKAARSFFSPGSFHPPDIEYGVVSPNPIYRLGYLPEALLERSLIEAGGYPFPVLDKEVSRIAPSVGYRKDRDTKLQGLLDHDLRVLFAGDRNHHVDTGDHGQAPAQRGSSCHHPHGDTVLFGHPNRTFDIGSAVQARLWNPCLVAILQINPAVVGVSASPLQGSTVSGDGHRLFVRMQKAAGDDHRRHRIEDLVGERGDKPWNVP